MNVFVDDLTVADFVGEQGGSGHQCINGPVYEWKRHLKSLQKSFLPLLKIIIKHRNFPRYTPL